MSDVPLSVGPDRRITPHCFTNSDPIQSGWYPVAPKRVRPDPSYVGTQNPGKSGWPWMNVTPSHCVVWGDVVCRTTGKMLNDCLPKLRLIRNTTFPPWRNGGIFRSTRNLGRYFKAIWVSGSNFWRPRESTFQVRHGNSCFFLITFVRVGHENRSYTIPKPMSCRRRHFFTYLSLLVTININSSIFPTQTTAAAVSRWPADMKCWQLIIVPASRRISNSSYLFGSE